MSHVNDDNLANLMNNDGAIIKGSVKKTKGTSEEKSKSQTKDNSIGGLNVEIKAKAALSVKKETKKNPQKSQTPDDDTDEEKDKLFPSVFLSPKISSDVFGIDGELDLIALRGFFTGALDVDKILLGLSAKYKLYDEYLSIAMKYSSQKEKTTTLEFSGALFLKWAIGMCIVSKQPENISKYFLSLSKKLTLIKLCMELGVKVSYEKDFKYDWSVTFSYGECKVKISFSKLSELSIEITIDFLTVKFYIDTKSFKNLLSCFKEVAVEQELVKTMYKKWRVIK